MLDIAHGGGMQIEELDVDSLNVYFRNRFIRKNTSAQVDKLKLSLTKEVRHIIKYSLKIFPSEGRK